MKKRFPLWILGILGIMLVIAAPVIYFLPKAAGAPKDPAAYLPVHPVHVDHADIIRGPFETPQEVTRACLECHPDAASELMVTSHWSWESKPADVPWRDAPVTIGKINQINNFCIGTQGNEVTCMACHTGYGWEKGRESALADQANVDCLVCHADMGTYGKGDYGNPAKGVDLLAAARSVRAPTRENCGKCHFDGGGGNGVKHGDLDESLYFPDENIDVHMGGLDFQCTDCHITKKHQVLGRMLVDNYTIEESEQVSCEQCHVDQKHADERINTHLASVACQTCHIPAFALQDPTKLTWDWSQAGSESRAEDHFTYLKIKGEFFYDRNVTPAYLWSNGSNAYRYILGDPLGADGVTYINQPAGGIGDPASKITPFKLHVAKQPYDVQNNYLLQPITSGEGGFWKDFDWNQAFELAEPITGLEYSGQYGFTETLMYWPTTHMVQPASKALKCESCHGDTGRMDWKALGYPGDPIEWGGRSSN